MKVRAYPTSKGWKWEVLDKNGHPVARSVGSPYASKYSALRGFDRFAERVHQGLWRA